MAETDKPSSPDETETQSKSWKVYKRKDISRFYAELRRKAEAEVKEYKQVFDLDQERQENDHSQRQIEMIINGKK